MPATLPVPSKGAIRALRRLALGTSCTIAFSAGMLTEDRRRRINAARQVHDNAKKIKLSRNYHSAGTALAGTFDEQVLRDRNSWTLQERPNVPEPWDDESLKDLHTSEPTFEEDPAKHVENGPLRLQEASKDPENCREEPHMHWRPTGPPSIQVRRHTLYDPATRFTRWQPPEVEWKPLFSVHPASEPQTTKSQVLDRQSKLASDIENILSSGDEPANIDAAASRFLDTLEEGLPLESSGLNESLVGAALELCKSCRAYGKSETFEKIFDKILSCGPIDQQVFFSFRPGGLIRAALKGTQNPATGHKRLDEQRLKKACTLFLTKFKDKPNPDAPYMEGWANLGLELCEQTYRHQLFKSTEDVYWNLEKYSKDVSNQAVKWLIKAVYEQKDYNRVAQYFRRFYTQTSPGQHDFYDVTKLVINSIVDVPAPKYDIAQDVMFSILEMAEYKNLKSSTTCVLKVLGGHWRAHRDILKIKSLFEQLEPCLQFTGHPQAVYGAIIQFCIEADDEASALAYYERMRETYEPNPDDVRIYGHFAYSKAMRKDWDGVRNDFRHMKNSNPKSDEYCAAFTPILHLFAKSETVRKTEELVREFIEQFGMNLTPYMSNIMIDKYLQAKEIDSVTRWLEYMYSVDAPIATNFFNSILINCHRKWKFSFEEIWQLYSSVKGKGKWTGDFINEGTESTMRSLAISALGQNAEPTSKKLKLWGRETADSARAIDIRDDMAIAVARGDPISALKLYKSALADQIPLEASAVSIAVQASLSIYPDNIDATAALLQNMVKRGQDVSDAMSSIFIHQISTIYNNAEGACRHVQEIARNTLSALEDRGIYIQTRAVTHVMTVLRSRNQNRQAIDFWESMSCRNGRSKISLDLGTLTVLLEAYIGLHDPAGIKWVMQMVTGHDITPDKRFKRVLTNARAKAEKQYNRGGILEEIICALDGVKEMRFAAEQEKDDVKIKTIRIMERAIEVQNARERHPN